MTKRYIEWDKLEKAKEDDIEYGKVLTERANLDNEIDKLYDELELLKAKKKDEPKEPKSFEDFAILSALLLVTYGEPTYTEARVIRVSDDTITVRVSTGYSCCDYVNIVVPIDELKNNQFYLDRKNGIFICDRVTTYNGFKTIMDAIFKVEKAQKEKRLAWVKEQIEKSEKECATLEKEIAQYDNIPLNKVEKMMNKISFATGWGSYGFDTKSNFIDNLPRVYKI